MARQTSHLVVLEVDAEVRALRAFHLPHQLLQVVDLGPVDLHHLWGAGWGAGGCRLGAAAGMRSRRVWHWVGMARRGSRRPRLIAVPPSQCLLIRGTGWKWQAATQSGPSGGWRGAAPPPRGAAPPPGNAGPPRHRPQQWARVQAYLRVDDFLVPHVDLAGQHLRSHVTAKVKPMQVS